MSEFNWDEYPTIEPKKSSSSFSWDDYPAIQPKEEHPILDTIANIGETIDSFTGAPTRAAIGAIQDGKNPVNAFFDKLGGDPRTVPTGKQIAMKAGVSDSPIGVTFSGDQALKAASYVPGLGPLAAAGAALLPDTFKDRQFEPTKADLAGAGVDVLADYSNLIPVGAMTKGISKTAGAAAKVGSKVGEVVMPAARIIPGVQTAETIAKVTAEGASKTAEALGKMFSPKVAPDFKKLSKIAEANGIDKNLLPESVEFGKDSFISRASRNRAEGPLGEPLLQKYQKAQEAVQGATEKKIAEIAGGSVPSEVEAGELIRSGFDKSVDDLFNNIGMTHNKVLQSMPGLQVAPESLQKIDSKLLGLERWAAGRSERGFTQTQRTQADQVLRAAEAVRKGNGSYKQTVEALRDIGEVAFKASNSLADVPPDIQKFRDLYFTIDEALIGTVEKAAGKEVADELKESNKIISNFLTEKSKVANIIGNKRLGPEKVFQTLVDHGDTAKINALKELLPPDVFQKLKGAFLDAQIKRNAEQGFSFKTLHNNLRNKKSAVGAILEPEEINQISDLITLGDRLGDPVMSHSGTGGSFLFRNVGEGIRSGIENDAVVGVLKDKARANSLKEAAPKELDLAKVYGKQASVKTIGEAGKQAEQLANALSSEDVAQALKSSKIENTKTNSSILKALSITPFAAKLSMLGKDDKELKGPVRWVFNGVDNIQSHSQNGFSDEELVSLVQSKKGRDLLMRASDLKPGSKAMQDIVQQIKTESKNNG